jgi:hypothetical protein
MHVVHGEGLKAQEGLALWKVLAVGVLIGVVIARIFDSRPVRVVRFAEVPHPGPGAP